NPPFSHQHDVRRIQNGDITVFDNGNLRIPPASYAEEYFLDEENKTATLVWSYKHPQVNNEDVFTLAAGNVQRLENGNTLINYAIVSEFQSFPSATEVTPNGEIVWEIKFLNTESQVYSYRLYKYLWSPCAHPTDYTLAASSSSSSVEKLFWGKGNGGVAYRI